MLILEIVAIGALVAAIAIVVGYTCYNMGRYDSLGKPRPQPLMEPGATYAFASDFVEVREGGSQAYRALLKRTDKDCIEYCAPSQPLPAPQVIVVKDKSGNIRLQPIPAPAPKPEPEPKPEPQPHIDVIA